jgi:hypothetical protein
LFCGKCRTWALPGNLRNLISETIDYAKTKKTFVANFNPEGGRSEVNYAGYPSFKFSSMDYMFYPGLWRPQQDGYLTPIFFRRRVLLRYQSDPTYDLHFVSNSYGTVVIPSGHKIPFGINRQGLLVMWLGDISALPDDEISYLKSENVDSDHELASDFYRGQIDVEYAYQSSERTLLELHKELSERFQKDFGTRLSHYDSEQILETLKSFAEPALWTQKELGNVWQSMNSVLIESLNVDGLKVLLAQYAPDFKVSGLKGLKLLEKVLACIFEGIPAETIAPFFVLYDLRVISAHKDSKALDEKFKSCYERLELNCSGNFESLHSRLVERLCQAYSTVIKSQLKS